MCRSQEGSPEEDSVPTEEAGSTIYQAANESSGARLLMLHFSVDQLALEVG